MPLYLRDLLADPALGLELVAGKRGANTQTPVRWAHISEIPDPTPWLEGGEILLTTGLGVKDSEDLQRRLVEGLSHTGCAAIGFGLDVFLGAVPPAMLAAADDCGLPLFTVPYETPFLAVTKRVSHETAEEHYATLRIAVNLHRQVLAAVVAERGIQEVVATATRPLADRAVVVFDYYGTELARQDSGDHLTADVSDLWSMASMASMAHQDEGFHRGQACSVSTVRLGDEVQAFVVTVAPNPPDEQQTLVLEQVVTGVTLELARGLSVRQAHRTRVDDVLIEAAEGRAPSSSWLTRLLRRLGFKVGQPFQVLCVRADLTPLKLCALVEDVLGSAPASTALVGLHDDTVYCILQPPELAQADQIVTAARSRGRGSIVVGQSAIWTAIADLPTAMRQALTAADAPTGEAVRDVRELGLAGVVAGMNNDVVAESFVEQVLGPLLHHDQTESSAFVDTLAAYLASGCRPGPAAKQLCVHRHTLAYRLERIRELTGRDPRDGRHLVEFGLALELRRSGRVGRQGVE